MAKSVIPAYKLVTALKKRHIQDLFLTEVKNGSTWLARKGDLKIMDVVAFKKSWTSPLISGYEIKVDRQDFLRDTKWPGYLPLCHQFSFVCPTGLIQPDELEPAVGLIWYNPEKDSLVTKRKPLFRRIEIPMDMLYYIAICRTESDSCMFSSKSEAAQAYLEGKTNDRDLGYRLGSKLALDNAELMRENERLKLKVEGLRDEEHTLQKVTRLLQANGFAPRWSETLEEKIEQLIKAAKGNPVIVERPIKDAIAILQKVIGG